MRVNSSWLLVVVALGLTVAVTAVFSLSATTSVTADRESNVTIVNDEASLLTLIDGHPNEGLVESLDEGVLSIDLTRAGADGANRDATIRLGSVNTPETDHAFRIVNQGTQTRSITAQYDLDTAGAGGGADNLRFTLAHDAGNDGTIDATATATENTGSSANVSGVDPGDPVYVTIRIDTQGLSAVDDLSGQLNLTAVGGDS